MAFVHVCDFIPPGLFLYFASEITYLTMTYLAKLHKPDLAFIILRVFLGIVLLFHGIAKVTNGVDGIENMLAGMGLPSFLAYGVLIGEVVAPALLIAGLFLAPAALVVAINMIVAIALAHSTQIFALSKNGGMALELQYLLLVTAVVVALMAPVRSRIAGSARVDGQGTSA